MDKVRGTFESCDQRSGQGHGAWSGMRERLTMVRRMIHIRKLARAEKLVRV
jgi:hypothetical protein